MSAMALHELDPAEFYRTNDMAMVTFLKLGGHAVQRCAFDQGGDTCYWYFRITDALLEETESFLDGTVRVEPREYSRKFNETKRELMAVRDGAFR